MFDFKDSDRLIVVLDVFMDVDAGMEANHGPDWQDLSPIEMFKGVNSQWWRKIPRTKHFYNALKEIEQHDPNFVLLAPGLPSGVFGSDLSRQDPSAAAGIVLWVQMEMPDYLERLIITGAVKTYFAVDPNAALVITQGDVLCESS